MGLRRGLRTAARAGTMARMAATARTIARSEGENRESAKRALAGLMADARGVPMKIGQFLASREGNDAFNDLVTGIPARPLEEMLPELERQLGRPASEIFASIDESVAAASLGQVHHAELLDGTEVAVKIRYPDIEDAVDAELRVAGLLPGVGPVKKWGFDIGGYQSMMKKNMDRELDYCSEAERQKRFRESVKVPGLVVPRVDTEFCAKGVLVQSWESGMPLESAANWSVEARRAAAEILMKTLFTSMFVTGEVHCDPHLGNLFVRKSASGAPQIVLLDFGCMTKVEPRERLALLKLILGCRNNDETDPLACFVEMGVSLPKLQAIAEILAAAPPEVTITIDSGAHRILLSQQWQARHPRGVLQSTGLCTMGCALPLAMGFKYARPDAPVIAFTGDAGLEMTLGELATLRDLALPLVVVVFVDRSLSLIELKQRGMGVQNAGVDFQRTDFAALARVYGGNGVTVTGPGETGPAVTQALAADRFTIIAVEIPRRAYDGLF